MSLVADFATLLATYPKGFVCIIEPFSTNENFRDSVLQLSCMDASIAIKHVFERFRTVVITSGTLSTLDYYPKVLGMKGRVCVEESFTMSVTRTPICPMVVTREATPQISSAYNKREDPSVIYNYGKLLSDMCKIVPDGMVCFFTSYAFMEKVILNGMSSTFWRRFKSTN